MYPYWASDFNQVYEEEIGHQYAGTPSSFCNGYVTSRGDEDSEGRFFDFDDGVSTVTICPVVFNGPYPFNSLTDALASNAITVLGEELENVVPRTVVLFHEMFHMVDYSNAKDVACEEGFLSSWHSIAGNADSWCADGVEDSLKARLAGAKVESSPDPLTFFAMSYYLSTKAPGPKYDWSTGMAREIRIH